MESAVTMAMLIAVMLFSLATAVLIEEVIFGSLFKLVLAKVNRPQGK